MTTNSIPKDLWNVLSQKLSEQRRQKIINVSYMRTNHICLVLQDVDNPHNIFACIRTAEAFGIQNIYCVGKKIKEKSAMNTSQGSITWLTIHHFQSIQSCCEHLKKNGYTIIAAIPDEGSVPLNDVHTDDPVAVVFGNERDGLSNEWNDYVDLYFTIPMFGFVESLNISVSAAITIQQLVTKAQNNRNYYLTNTERFNLLNQWALKKIPNAIEKYQQQNNLIK